MTKPDLPLRPSEFVSRLLEWYRRERRDLPWRRTSDPYRIWLSEIMLQQTQVKTVLPYYEKFLRAYPTVEKLAQADEHSVLSLWSGLGYYNRARNLHKAARVVCEKHGGHFPQDLKGALELPGIGRYTAGAILSAAYRQPLPILDGNVRRLLVRYLCLEAAARPKEEEAQLWNLLGRLVRTPLAARFVSEFNQALMELGALVCKPRLPDCSKCPLQESCLALKDGLEEKLPPPRRLRPVEKAVFVVAVIRRKGTYLLRQNLEGPILKDFWEFPRVEGRPGPGLEKRFLQTHGLLLKIHQLGSPVSHQVTFRRLIFFPALCSLRSPPPSGGWTWSRIETRGFPVSAYVRKVERVARSLSESTPRSRTGQYIKQADRA
ncbi:MAG: A/G-specific adenine glycosylase [Acidobacteriota bacterium]